MASRRFASCVALAVFSVAVLATPTAGAAPALTRNPYLTDATATSVRVNWATVSTGTAKVVTWGQAGTGCSQYAATATGTPFTVGSTTETMWSARLGNLTPRTSYCQQIVDGSSPVLASPITFTTIPAPGDTASFSFDVIGDTGLAATTAGDAVTRTFEPPKLLEVDVDEFAGMAAAIPIRRFWWLQPSSALQTDPRQHGAHR